MILKDKSLVYLINGVLVVILLFANCKKDNSGSQPELTTIPAFEITESSAKCGGIITSDGGESVTERGVCWNTEPNPTIMHNKTNDGQGGGSFFSFLTGLTGNKTYYVRAYATNKKGTSYGMAMSFTTIKLEMPVLTTSSITELTQYSAVSGGEISSDGGSEIITRGICWDTEPSPTILDHLTFNGSETGAYTSHIDGLLSNTKYYLRAYASNSVGTSYGNEISFTTLIDEDIFKLAGNGTKSWKLIRNVSTGRYPIEVGNEDHSQIWWAMGKSNNALHERPCMMNDEWIFSTNGTMQFNAHEDYWAEAGIFNPSEICASTTSMLGTNLQDLSAWGSGDHSYVIRKDPVRKLTALGKGAYIGFCKLGNRTETNIPLDSVCYNVVKLTDQNVDTLIIEGLFKWDPLQPGGSWRFVLVHYDNPGDEPPLP
ncbi:MAG: hypothetical protein ACOYN4_15890 [Bacteroidales bacterium]